MVKARDRRPSKHVSITAPRFVSFRPRRLDPEKIGHPMIVIRDLQKGCLTSLDIYLRIHKGIPDRAVAVELRKLISGTRARSKYRIDAIAHPDGPARKAGAPKKVGTAKPSERDFRLVRAFNAARQSYPKAAAAVAKVMADEKVSRSMVDRARAAVKKYERLIAELEYSRESRRKRADTALANVRQAPRGK